MRLTPDYIESQVESVEYTYSGTLTIATVTTKSGTKLVGHSACLDPKNYDREVGEQIARKNAVEQLWALEGYFIAKLGLSQVSGELDGSGLGLHVDWDKAGDRSYDKWYQHFRAVSCYVQPTAEEAKERLRSALATLGPDRWAFLPRRPSRSRSSTSPPWSAPSTFPRSPAPAGR